MDISKEMKDRYVTISPKGDLDANSSVFLDEEIRKLIDQEHVNIHVDMKGISYISSAGLGVFISFVDELGQKNGKFVLTGLADNVHDVFLILGLDNLDNLQIIKDPIDPVTHF